MRDAHQDQSTIHSELHTKKRVAHKDEGDIHSDLQTKMRLAHQDESAFRSKLKMTKFEEVFPDKTGTVRSVRVLVNPNEEMSKYKLLQDLEVKRHVSKFPMSVAIQENDDNEDEENLKNDEGVKDDDYDDLKNYEEVKDDVYDDDDVCDSMTKDVGSSFNSPDVNKHDRVKTTVEGEVDEEPGGNVSARSRSPQFRHSKA